MVNIVLADDHILVREGMKKLLEDETDFAVVGEADNGAEAVELTRNLKPEILVTDLKMPRMDGIEVTQQVRNSSPNTRVIVISMYGFKPYADAALKAGAYGYVHKKSSAEGLIEAIRTVVTGNTYISPSVSGNTG